MQNYSYEVATEDFHRNVENPTVLQCGKEPAFAAGPRRANNKKSKQNLQNTPSLVNTHGAFPRAKVRNHQRVHRGGIELWGTVEYSRTIKKGRKPLTCRNMEPSETRPNVPSVGEEASGGRCRGLEEPGWGATAYGIRDFLDR